RRSDVAEPQLGTAAARWHRDTSNLLALDRRGHRRVAKERLRDAEVATVGSPPLAEHPAASGQDAHPDEQPHARLPRALGVLLAEQGASRSCQTDERHGRPDDETGSLQARERAG